MKQDHDKPPASDHLYFGSMLEEARLQLLDAAASGQAVIAARTPKEQRLHEERFSARLTVGIPVRQGD